MCNACSAACTNKFCLLASDRWHLNRFRLLASESLIFHDHVKRQNVGRETPSKKGIYRALSPSLLVFSTIRFKVTSENLLLLRKFSFSSFTQIMMRMRGIGNRIIQSHLQRERSPKVLVTANFYTCIRKWRKCCKFWSYEG